MSKINKSIVLVVGIWILHSWSATVNAQEDFKISAGLKELAGELNGRHRYLFQEVDWAEFDELCRQLIGPQLRRRRRLSQAQRQEAARRSAEAAEKLLPFLEKCPRVIRLSLIDDQITEQIDGPVKVPGDVGALLFRIQAGEGETRYTTVFYDMSLANGPGEGGRGSGAIGFKIASPGVTWVLVSMTNVPGGPTSLLVEFQYPPDKSVSMPVDILAPAKGRTKISILSADTGQPVPAMVNLRWKVNGADRRPSNGIDFGSQIDMRERRYGPRPARIPGRLAEYNYWCVPGPFDMMLPPGDWEIVIRRGVEHTPLIDTFSLAAEDSIERIYTVTRWIDMRKLGWYSGDDHVHCKIMSDQDARRLMAWVRAEDVHVVNTLKVGDVYRTFFPQRGFGKAYRVIDGDYVIVPGQECPRIGKRYAIGHTISLNIQSMVRDPGRYYLYDWVADTVHAQGGLFGYAHGQTNQYFVSRDMSINIPKQKADFLEILQFGQLGTDLYYDFLNMGFKVTASAGTDVPWGGTVGEVRVYAYVGDKTFSADAWFDAVKQGRTFVSNGPMITFQVDEALPGDEILIDRNRQLRVRASAVGDPENMLPIKLEIIRHGQVIRSAETKGAQQKELSVDFELNADHGFWIAARAEGGDGSYAHTTPVYVIRRGLRFWKYDGVDQLITARLAELAKVEELTREAMQLTADGRAAMDLMVKRLGLQGSAMLKNVEEAKQIYQKLKQTAEHEKSLRAEYQSSMK
ncbi:MAG: CehA/McbA family metallohydrolase [Planctomycetota bacterium]|nr:MAG: CehA/McbA family metallohydrolase [Planctomycetota bacterium]